MGRARSISSVLRGRLQRLELPDLGYNVTWAQRTPADAPAVAHEIAAGLDQRARALGERLAASPEPWLASQPGVLAPHVSPLLREDYARRAAAAAAYRKPPGSPTPARPSHPNRTTATRTRPPAPSRHPRPGNTRSIGRDRDRAIGQACIAAPTALRRAAPRPAHGRARRGACRAPARPDRCAGPFLGGSAP